MEGGTSLDCQESAPLGWQRTCKQNPPENNEHKQSALAPSRAVLNQARQMIAKVILDSQGSVVWTQAAFTSLCHKNMVEKLAHSALSEWSRAVRGEITLHQIRQRFEEASSEQQMQRQMALTLVIAAVDSLSTDTFFPSENDLAFCVMLSLETAMKEIAAQCPFSMACITTVLCRLSDRF